LQDLSSEIFLTQKEIALGFGGNKFNLKSRIFLGRSFEKGKSDVKGQEKNTLI